MSALVQIPTVMTDVSILVEAIRKIGKSPRVEANDVIITDYVVEGRPIRFCHSKSGYIAQGINLNSASGQHTILRKVVSNYNLIFQENLRIAAEVERLRILEEQRRIKEQTIQTIISQAKARNFRIKEEDVNGQKRITLVKVVSQ
jgi:hypothetical protein